MKMIYHQQALLRHPKTKLMVTQGGQKSVWEAVCAAMPALVVPFVSDQMKNGWLLQRAGCGLLLPKEQLLEAYRFTDAIHRLLDNRT